MLSQESLYIIIPMRNQKELLKETVQSIEALKNPHDSVKVVFVDNASTDGSYEQALEYVIENPKKYSVFRESVLNTDGRLLKKTVYLLRHTHVDYSMLMNPGELIYEKELEQAVGLLSLYREADFVISEVDVIEEDIVRSVQPIFTENFVIRPYNYRSLYYRYGIGHKIKVIHRKMFLKINIKMTHFGHITRFNDWLTMSFYANGRAIYNKNKIGAVLSDREDVLDNMMNKALFLKNCLYPSETGVFSSRKNNDFIQRENIGDAYRSLSLEALKKMVKVLNKGEWGLAEELLIYARMIYPLIQEEKIYSLAEKALDETKWIRVLEEVLVESEVIPPTECLQF